jgi:AraC-like DNA-binding protein
MCDVTRYRFVEFVVASALTMFGYVPGVFSAEPDQRQFAGLADEYATQVRPLAREFCLGCHSTAARTGELDLERFSTLDEARRDTKAWLKVAEMLDNGEMPPKSAKQPAPEQRKELRGWVERYLHAEALARAGDPGPVVLRRLNNAEYTYTVRDLTRVELEPAREFPADSAAGEGFTNTGNALVMSPALLGKYLGAGKEIARHAVLLPDGFRFSPQATRRDWTDEILAEIRELYAEFADTADLGVGSEVGNVEVHGDTRIGLAGRLPLEKYFAATLAERDALAAGGKTIAAVARERGLSPKYLATLWSSLNGSAPSLLLDDLRARWRRATTRDAAALAADVAAWQRGLWVFGPVGLIGRKGGPSRWMEPVNPLVTRQDVRFPIPEELRTESEVVLSLVTTDATGSNDHDFVVWREPRLVLPGRADIYLRDVRELYRDVTTESGEWGLDPAMFGKHPAGKTVDAASLVVRVPSVVKVRLPGVLAAGRELLATAALDQEAGREGSVQVDVTVGTSASATRLLPSEVVVTFSRVTQVFSDRRDVSFRRGFLTAEDSRTWKRFETAFDEHRALFPAALCFNQIVPVDEVLTLAMFYREDDHLVRLMLDDQRRARLNRLWKELHYVSQSALLGVTALDLLLEAMQGNGVEDRSQYLALKPLRGPIHRHAAAFKKELIADETRQVDALVAFAGQAYRRPLTGVEADELRGLYRRLREQDLSHDDAFRLTLARVFVAPAFLYRLENAPEGPAAKPVSDWELASRLSYFLWSSQPDEELRAPAASGRLHQPEVLKKQIRRMLTDARVRRLATEFGGQWLHIDDFDSLDEKSEKHFPEFEGLRGDMYEESIRFFTDLFQSDASLLRLLDADHTFVNERLARFYGIDGIPGERWRRVDGMRRLGRGGILGLATTLARQSGASRTSPILRGNWVSEVLLGEKLPRPPREVPQLPSDETATDGQTVRQLVARHTSDPRCASCHQRIDPFGFALEGFDAIGRRRDADMAGRPIDTRTQLPDGSEIEGLEGLRDYLFEKRRDAILSQFCRKLLGYALGREVQLSDEPLLTEMLDQLRKKDYRFSVAVDMIVLSPQFREIRGREAQLAQAP